MSTEIEVVYVIAIYQTGECIARKVEKDYRWAVEIAQYYEDKEIDLRTIIFKHVLHNNVCELPSSSE